MVLHCYTQIKGVGTILESDPNESTATFNETKRGSKEQWKQAEN